MCSSSKEYFFNKYQTCVYVLNLSLSQGVLPSELKVARVIPIYKVEDAMKINNYRSVSVLPLFSKIFERVMYDRINNFITKNNILYNINLDSGRDTVPIWHLLY